MGRNLSFLGLLDAEKYFFWDPQGSVRPMVNQIFMAEELFHLRSFEVWWGRLHLGYNRFFWLSKRIHQNLVFAEF